VALAGSSKFANTCQYIDGEGTTLHAQCQERKNGQLILSALDLNRCIKNDKGKLKVRQPPPPVANVQSC
jgi:hypothetical protein